MTRIKLTLACPQALAEQMSEFLLDCEQLRGGFTAWHANGHGADFATASLREQVRGSVHVFLLTAIIDEAGLAALLASLRAQFRASHIRYWTEPVLDFGDLM
ncbi:MAG: DUF3240 family protein [Alphaproteobacteria bacterium]|nr:DUF3240 family protein [Alphaproteobacteria bacterium]